MGIKVEKLFSSFRYHLHYIDFQGSPVSFYYITSSLSLSSGCGGCSRVVDASHVLVAAAFW